jgi:hypothetical protein
MHLAPDHGVVEVEQLEVRGQAAGPDAHDEAALGEMIEHRGEAGDHRRMLLGQIEHPGAQADPLGQRDRLGHEHQGRGDRLGHRAEMLADPDVVEAQAVGLDHRLQVLLEHLVVVPRRRMQRHHEQPEPHRRLPVVIPPKRPSRSRAAPLSTAQLPCGTACAVSSLAPSRIRAARGNATWRGCGSRGAASRLSRRSPTTRPAP